MIQYRCVEVDGQRFVECPDFIFREVAAAAAANPDIPKPAPVSDPIFKKWRDPTKIYYSKADLNRLARGEVC